MITVHQDMNYADDLYNFLKRIECAPESQATGDLLPYFDNKKAMKVTIGIGFNIEGPSQDGLLRAVLRQFGLDPANTSLTADQRAAEQGWYNLISSKLTQNFFTATGSPDNDALRAALDKIMLDRSNDPALSGLAASKKRTFFGFYDGNEVRAAYNAIVPAYETTLDTWLTSNGINTAVPDFMVHGNRERMALLSMAWQGWIGGTTSSPMLARALRNDDRAEAWYEIRYNTNVEARRILEADTFGLYNAGVNPSDQTTMTDADALAAFRTYTRNRAEIDADEASYSANGMLNTATTWGTQLGTPVQTLAADLQPARDYLVSHYAFGTNITHTSEI